MNKNPNYVKRDVAGVMSVHLRYKRKILYGAVMYLFLLIAFAILVKPVYLLETDFIEKHTDRQECIQFIKENDADNADTAIVLSVILLDVMCLLGVKKITRNIAPMSAFRSYMIRRIKLLRSWYNESNRI